MKLAFKGPWRNLIYRLSQDQMAISRSREYEANRIGAEFCGHPDWLADALY